MLEALISSRTRIKLLLKFFLNSNTTAYLRGLETEFEESSSNAIRIELNRLESASMLTSSQQGNKKVFRANTDHPLFNEVHNILLKHIGIDHIIENVIERLGNVEKVYLVGAFARGIDSKIIDLIFIGNIDKEYLLSLVGKVEKLILRKIRYIIYLQEEYNDIDWNKLGPQPLLLWSKE
ncbi:MAG: ArsR family transcriptional regulator [Bacteroidetes bacterium]|nr:ArsR family transcriptional regulator [Bacteroidota bacterium]